jgi:hypothetical protein
MLEIDAGPGRNRVAGRAVLRFFCSAELPEVDILVARLAPDLFENELTPGAPVFELSCRVTGKTGQRTVGALQDEPGPGVVGHGVCGRNKTIHGVTALAHPAVRPARKLLLVGIGVAIQTHFVRQRFFARAGSVAGLTRNNRVAAKKRIRRPGVVKSGEVELEPRGGVVTSGAVRSQRSFVNVCVAARAVVKGDLGIPRIGGVSALRRVRIFDSRVAPFTRSLAVLAGEVVPGRAMIKTRGRGPRFLRVATGTVR